MALQGFEGLGSALLSGFALIKAVSALPWFRKSDPREDYRFLKEFLQDLELNKDMPLYLQDRGYRGLVRGAKVEPALIQCALKVRTYQDALTDCALGHQFLEATLTGSGPQLSFKAAYLSERSRKQFRRKSFALYALYYFLTTSPALFAMWSSANDPRYLWMLIFTVPAFGPLTVLTLRKGKRLDAAERLVKKDLEQREQAALPTIGGDVVTGEA